MTGTAPLPYMNYICAECLSFGVVENQIATEKTASVSDQMASAGPGFQT